MTPERGAHAVRIAHGALVLGAVSLVVAFTAGVLLPTGERARIAAPRHRIDLATASAAELALLQEVGPALAARVIADRALHGRPGSLDELTRVDGMGERTLQALRASDEVWKQPLTEATRHGTAP